MALTRRHRAMLARPGARLERLGGAVVVRGEGVRGAERDAKLIAGSDKGHVIVYKKVERLSR